MTQEKNVEKTKEYEILYFLSIALNDEEIKNIKHKLNQIIIDYKGAIIKEEDIGKKKLAYMIKNARHGYYILTIFSANPKVVSKIDHQIKLMPEILRHQLGIKENIKKLSPESSKTTVDEQKIDVKTKLSKDKAKDKEKRPIGKVDIRELDRKIDELLGEENI